MAQRCPVDSLHVRTADGLEELGVQLLYISGAYCADTSPEFGLWKSLWRRSGAKAGSSFDTTMNDLLPQDMVWFLDRKLPQVWTSKIKLWICSCRLPG